MLPQLLIDDSWYVLRIPSEEMGVRSFEQVRCWQEIASALLRKYCKRLYEVRRAAWESKHLEYATLTADDGNFAVYDYEDDNGERGYLFQIEQSRKDIVTTLEELKEIVRSGKLRDFDMFHGIHPVLFGRHLYQPLVYVSSDLVEVKPVSLSNDGERDFVVDLKRFCDENAGFFEGKELYLLRNMSRGRGIGFFEAGNFHPDFILWLLADGRQYINFVDPKGIRNLKGQEDPKIMFHQTIKSIENDLRAQDPTVTLNSFIMASTRLPDVSWWAGGMTKQQFEERHVLFQNEDKATYIGKMLATIMTG